MAAQPELSIVIPAYNESARISVPGVCPSGQQALEATRASLVVVRRRDVAELPPEVVPHLCQAASRGGYVAYEVVRAEPAE